MNKMMGTSYQGSCILLIVKQNSNSVPIAYTESQNLALLDEKPKEACPS